jgi:hypothetical protein
MGQVVTDPTAVMGALEEQVGCYRVLAKLAARQHEHVQNDHTEGLLEVLKEREGLLDRLSALEKTVGPARRDWVNFVGRLPVMLRAKAEGMMNEAKALLAEITAGDEKDAIALQQRKHRIGNELRQTASAAVVNRGYAAAAYGKARGTQVDRAL